jgi:hypothetical protein
MECVYCAVRTGYLNVIWVICFIWIWEQTAIISLYNIKWLVCIIEMECVYCAVRTGCLNVIQVNISVQVPDSCCSIYVPVTVHRERFVKREREKKTNKMQQSDIYYQLLSQHVSGIIMPIFGRTKTVCYCIRCTALVLLDVVGSGCGALRCRMRAVQFPHRLTWVRTC